MVGKNLPGQETMGLLCRADRLDHCLFRFIMQQLLRGWLLLFMELEEIESSQETHGRKRIIKSSR